MADDTPRSIRLDALAYGGDYNPDQWSEEVWLEDARLMREAGVNLVSLPVFSWPQLEPQPGRLRLGLARPRHRRSSGSAGIRIDLATATATPPSWLVRSHPEMLPWNERRPASRVRLAPGLLPELAGLARARRADDPRHGRALRRAPRARALARLERVRRPRLALLVPRVIRVTSGAGSRRATATSTGSTRRGA